MRKLIEKTFTKVEYEYFCDECGVEMEYKCYKVQDESLKKMVGTCCVCGKDICSECVGSLEESGDYVNYICKSCWNIYKKYEDKIKKIENDLELLEEERDKECIENRKTI